MLAPALNLVVGQRLLRQLHTCATRREASLPESQEVKSVLATLHDTSPRTKAVFSDKVPYAV